MPSGWSATSPSSDNHEATTTRRCEAAIGREVAILHPCHNSQGSSQANASGLEMLLAHCPIHVRAPSGSVTVASL